jgi:hypothetical protein
MGAAQTVTVFQTSRAEASRPARGGPIRPGALFGGGSTGGRGPVRRELALVAGGLGRGSRIGRGASPPAVGPVGQNGLAPKGARPVSLRCRSGLCLFCWKKSGGTRCAMMVLEYERLADAAGGVAVRLETPRALSRPTSGSGFVGRWKKSGAGGLVGRAGPRRVGGRGGVSCGRPRVGQQFERTARTAA